MQKREMQDYILMAFSGTRLWIRRVTAENGKMYWVGQQSKSESFRFQKETWYGKGDTIIREKMLCEEEFFGERGTVYIEKADRKLPETGKIRMEEGKTITIGSDYGNTVFYSFCTGIRKKHVLCELQNGVYHVKNLGEVGCYVNGRALVGETIIEKGDKVQLYGLCLQLLPPYLIVVTLVGQGRITERNHVSQLPVLPRVGKRGIRYLEEMTQKCNSEEIEVLMPKEFSKENRQPLLLTLGPSATMTFPILLMAYFNGRMNPDNSKGFYYITVLTGVCSAIFSILWGVTNHLYSKRIQQQERKGRCRQYREYLQTLDRQLQERQDEFRSFLTEKYPMTQWYLQHGHISYVAWNRYCPEEERLFVPLGYGTRPSPFTLHLSDQGKKILPDFLSDEALELRKHYEEIMDVPVGILLMNSKRIAIDAGEMNEEIGFQFLVQLVARYPKEQVTLVCFFEEECRWQHRFAECMKWSPHCWSVDGRTRYLAGNREEASEILPVLTKEMAETDHKRSYVIFLWKEEWIQGEVLHSCLLRDPESYPVTVIGCRSKDSLFEGKWNEIIKKTQDGFQKISFDGQGMEICDIQMKSCRDAQVERYMRGLAECPRASVGDLAQIPEKVDFLELFQCHRVEELQSEYRWMEAKPEKRLKVPIGKSSGGNLVFLDVHEKFHGPHGLIAGTTGSGKSELLQTYLLSLAVNFGPQDLTFFMIDYKGGGTGNSLKGLPHCAGVVSNLSGRQMNRAMLAITSENKRRQRLLSEAEVNHIDAYTNLYREGKVSFPLSHLLIVIDEFAELKREEPEFMQQIISLAQVGRSLGVHLLLATQKPSGTVDEKIWSNAKFRLCLKVQDRQDSVDMLHKPDAALLTRAGQCYLQIGNDELYRQFQTAYCGGVYEPVPQRDDAVFVTKTGKEFTIGRENVSSHKESVIDIIINYVNKISSDYGYEKAVNLWTEELPDHCYYEDANWNMETADLRRMLFLLGVCDDPENQCRQFLTYAPLEQGHLAVCGGPSTGKTFFLRGILEQICQFYTPWQISYLILSVEQEGLISYTKTSHCVGSLLQSDHKDIFFYQLHQWIKNRKKQLAGQNYKTMLQQRETTPPLLLIFIDGFSNLRKCLSEEQEEELLRIAAEGIGSGVLLVMSATGTGDFPAKLFQKVKTTVSLEMSDPYQYGDVLRKYHGYREPASGVPGRGLCKWEGRILEFQTVLFRNQGVPSGEGTRVYERFPEIPMEPQLKHLERDFWQRYGQEENGDAIPIAYDRKTGELVLLGLHRAESLLISGGDQTGKTNFVKNLITLLFNRKERTIVIDFAAEHKDCQMQDTIQYLTTGRQMDDFFLKDGEERKFGVILIVQMSLFSEYLYRSDERHKQRTLFWEKIFWEHQKEIVIGCCHPQKDGSLFMTNFFKTFMKGQRGIHLGGNVALQRNLFFDDLPYAKLNGREDPGIGFYKQGIQAATREIQIPLWCEGGKSDD